VLDMWEVASSFVAAAAFALTGDAAAFAFTGDGAFATSFLLPLPPDLILWLPFWIPLTDSLLFGGVPFDTLPLDFGPSAFFELTGLFGLTVTREPNGPS
jgi:hypothetical protein